MQEIIKEIDVLTNCLFLEKGKIQEEIRLLEKRAEALDLEKANLGTKEASLEEREEAVKKIEDVVSLQTSANKTLKAVKEEREALKKERESFDAYVVEKKSEISQGLVRNETASENNKNEAKALIDLRAKLEDEKKNFKQKMAEGIVKNATR